ncbi:MAG: APC family permease [Solirubrobacterales bacterium]|nr:APC family permease [Solirubrobacterales bacterium]MBV9166147.1 APC family permease [Solirubrobacterales bacterium]MBV9534070.1 APC family permease [Solirubrobacterales bacterium]
MAQAETTPEELQAPETGFRRALGLVPATAINMTQMCGIGPFITIPIMVATMGGPQATIGWIAGALLAMADGLVWAELGAAMPSAGGTYVYLREAFQYRSGKLMPFLFIWTAMLTIPLIMATGIIGIIDYLGYFLPHLGFWSKHLIGLGFTAAVLFALYRRIESIRILTTFLWIVMLAAVALTIASAFTHFQPHLAFTYPAGAFGAGFVGGLGAGLIVAIYDYLGYYTVAEMGDELASPGRVMPRSIMISIGAMCLIYLALNIGVIGTMPWQQVAKSTSVASAVVTRNWSHAAADGVTVLIIITAFASVFAGLLGGSRLPYHAARDRVFFRFFGRLHRQGFPHVALLALGLITAIGSFFNLTTVINLLLATTVLVQAVPQIVALTVLRRRQPSLYRPYKQWLYPLPSLAALAGWIYVYTSASSTSLIGSAVWILAGIGAYLAWARAGHHWPFAAPEVNEVYLDEQRREAVKT